MYSQEFSQNKIVSSSSAIIGLHKEYLNKKHTNYKLNCTKTET